MRDQFGMFTRGHNTWVTEKFQPRAPGIIHEEQAHTEIRNPKSTIRNEESLATPTATAPESGSLEDVERRHIESVLKQTNWMIEGERGAAKVLAMNPSTLRSRMQKLGVKRPSRAA